MQSEGFSNQSFEAISLNGKLYAFFADHHADARMIQTVFASKKQNILARNLATG